MALWRDATANTTPAQAPANIMPKPAAAETPPRASPEPLAVVPTPPAPRHKERADTRESVIATGLAIEGKISGTGHVRIAGQFKGDAHVDGNLSIEPGAKHHGEVRASTVTVSGELTGNIGAKHIDVTATGVIVGDVKADTITVASGSRMRGHVEFGWGDGSVAPVRGEHKGSGTST
jgi:cytoskeletal protein CcmA (bactofilin family)